MTMRCNGHDCLARIVVPQKGAWTAELVFVDDAPGVAAGAATLKLGATSLQGTIVDTGVHGVQRRALVVGGAGGWSSVLDRKAYHNDAGVKASLVASDAATAASESLAAENFAGAVVRLGNDYVRRAGVAAATLEDAARGALWWVALDGTTHVGARASTAAPADAYEVLAYDPKTREAVLAIDDLEHIGVGSVISKAPLEAPLVIRELDVSVTASAIRAIAWCGDSAGHTRLAAALESLVGKFSQPELHGIYQYRAIGMSGDRVRLQAVRATLGLPNIGPIGEAPGVAGWHSKLTPGAIVLVAFVDGDRAAPRIIGFSGRDMPGHVPEEISFANGTAPVAHLGAAIQTYFPEAILVGGLLNGVTPITGTLVFTGSAPGVIATGSPKIKVPVS